MSLINCGLQVLVTNQITVASGGASRDTERESDWSDGHVTAALGNTWAHCVNTRLFLDRQTHPYRLVSLTHAHTHTWSVSYIQVTVDKSPLSTNKRVVVKINERGVVSEQH